MLLRKATEGPNYLHAETTSLTLSNTIHRIALLLCTETSVFGEHVNVCSEPSVRGRQVTLMTMTQNAHALCFRLCETSSKDKIVWTDRHMQAHTGERKFSLPTDPHRPQGPKSGCAFVEKAKYSKTPQNGKPGAPFSETQLLHGQRRRSLIHLLADALPRSFPCLRKRLGRKG